MFYFAFIDENSIVTGVYSMPSDLSSIPGYIAITEQQYNDSNAGNENSLIGKRYDAETNTFVDVPVWSCNATEVQYGDGAVSVAEALDAINEELDGLGDIPAPVDAYSKEESDNRYATADHSHTGFANASHSHTATDLSGVVKTINGTAPDESGNVTVSVSGGGMTANEVLEAVKSVDGANSGLDADTLDGMEASAFATADHSHTGYAEAEHTHTGFAAEDHTHSDYAPATHTHDGYATSDHTHNDYITATTYANGMSGKADSDHTHSQSEISGLSSALSGKADANHSHSGYASSGHSHSGYFEKTGGTISGETNFSGGLVRAKGAQAIFHSGSQLIYGTNNLPTRIAGNAISATKTITVDSDRRLKENINGVDADTMVDFIKNIDVKTFNYIGDNAECIGVIAQELQEVNPDIAKYLVSENEEGYLGVKAADLVFPLIATVQKLAKEIEELKK